MKIFRTVLFFGSIVVAVPLVAGEVGEVVNAINALGLDLYRAQPSDNNLLLSPYSIQKGLAMAYAGADGETYAEMQRVLHYPTDEAALHAGLAKLTNELMQITKDTPAELYLANRLFVQRGYELRAPFLALLKNNYGTTPDQLDFIHAAESARAAVNRWAEDNTKGKIEDLIPVGGLSDRSRLVLADAIYLKARWESPFDADATKPGQFFVRGATGTEVPTMSQRHLYGYKHHFFRGFSTVSLFYIGQNLQFLILLPDARDGLPALERELTPKLLAECAKLPPHDVILYLPKFRFTSPSMPLGAQLRQFGLKTTFDTPQGSANFDRMAPRKPDDYLYIGEVFHKAFISVDEKETEAAATEEVMVMDSFGISSKPLPPPIIVRVDHPFLFAIQHVPSGTCLFLGRVTDPRE